jgi:hypothetical protein
MSLDAAILFETLRTLVADKQYVEPPSTSLTMLGEGEGRIVSAPESPPPATAGPASAPDTAPDTAPASPRGAARVP